MKKFALASIVAVTSLGLAACAEPAEDEAVAEVEEDVADVSPPVAEMAGEDMEADDAPDAGESNEAEAVIGPNGDPAGPRPNRD